MESISLSYFVDFMLTHGTSRIASAHQIKRGPDERYSDFYKPVRESIIDMHSRGLDTRVLADMLSSLTDSRELRIFPKVVIGYSRFLRRYHKITWFEPPRADHPLGDLHIRANPELGLILDGRPHALKLHFRGEPLTPQRAVLINEIAARAFSAEYPGMTFGVLDVRRARLFERTPRPGVSRLLQAEAASLSALLQTA
ncbi:MAG: hypothetical protein R3B70_09630 [Polyangiaceae bacterium]